MSWVQVPSLAPRSRSRPVQPQARDIVPREGRVERDVVLFANEAFYRAFASRDVAAMERLW